MDVNGEARQRNILFVYGGLPLGGIETFLIRMSKYFHGQNVSITTLFLTHNGDAKLFYELSKFSKIVYLDEIKYSLSPYFCHGPTILNLLTPLHKELVAGKLGLNYDHIHALDTFSLLMAKRILKFYPGTKLSCGVYHDQEYDFKHLNKTYFGRRLSEIVDSVPPENVIFFNDHSPQVFAKTYQKDFSGSLVVPIGIDTNTFTMRELRPRTGTVTSIGRLVPFKSYNIHAIHAVKGLRDRGIMLDYEIYGSGESRQLLEAMIQDLDLQGQVTLKGDMDYSNFASVVDGSLAFIGSGTALIEASACGVPAIIGIEGETAGKTYGFLHQIKGLAYHDQNLDFELTSIEERLEYLVTCSVSEYEADCHKAHLRAKDFSIENTGEKWLKAWNRFRIDDNPLNYLGIWQIVSNCLFNYMLRPAFVFKQFFGRHSKMR